MLLRVKTFCFLAIKTLCYFFFSSKFKPPLCRGKYSCRYALFQIDCLLLLLKSILLFTVGIGIFKCDPHSNTQNCQNWTSGPIDDLDNLLSIHNTISGFGISICIFLKVLSPLLKYMEF